MKYLQKIVKMFLYADIEKEEYIELLPSIREENRLLLKIFSQLGSVTFFILLFSSLLSGKFFTLNSSTYLVSAIAMIVLYFVSQYILPTHSSLVMVFVCIFEITLYIFSIQVSMLHAENPAVSAIVFLMVSPLLFYDRPVRLFLLLALDIVIFCVITISFKEPKIAKIDIWNMITFGVVALAVTMFIMSIKIRALAQSRQIEYLSQTDLLTGVKNRNHYENRLKEYSQKYMDNLICVYCDVNGLHEMNNNHGHQAGDNMLKEIAAALQNIFGPEHTYRIGGDEFVSFQIDGQPEKLSSEMDRMKQELLKKDCNISLGIAASEKNPNNSSDIFTLVKEAENKMYADKREFYRHSENDRRHRYNP